MSGVWVFKNGVTRLVENPGEGLGVNRGKVLVHIPSNEVITSYSRLEEHLSELGWERYAGGDGSQRQYHKTSSVDLISLPKDFSHFSSMHMYDIVIKNRDKFEVRNA